MVWRQLGGVAVGRVRQGAARGRVRCARLVLGERNLRLLHHSSGPLPFPSPVAPDGRVAERGYRHRQSGLICRLSLGAEWAAVVDRQRKSICTLPAQGEVPCGGAA